MKLLSLIIFIHIFLGLFSSIDNQNIRHKHLVIVIFFSFQSTRRLLNRTTIFFPKKILNPEKLTKHRVISNIGLFLIISHYSSIKLQTFFTSLSSSIFHCFTVLLIIRQPLNYRAISFIVEH